MKKKIEMGKQTKKKNSVEKNKGGGKKQKWRRGRKLDRRLSLERELKSIHATRALCRYQNLGVLSNSTR